jgi:hypothetical protein
MKVRELILKLNECIEESGDDAEIVVSVDKHIGGVVTIDMWERNFTVHNTRSLYKTGNTIIFQVSDDE